jgi:hypothetical protein
VPTTGAGRVSKALILFDSDLASVSLKITQNITVDNTVPSGKTRSFDGAGNLTGNITVENGGTLTLLSNNADLASTANKTISVSGTLNFNGTDVAPTGPITVNVGGRLAFNGAGAKPKGDITVNGELLIGEGGTVKIDSGKKLSVNGILSTPELEVKGVTYEVPLGGALEITGKIDGSIIAATVGNSPVNVGTFKVAPGGYIRDTTPKKSWTLDGGNRGGIFRYTGNNGKIITLGAGEIKTNGTPKGSPIVDVVTFVDTTNPPPYPASSTSIVVHDYKGNSDTVGLTLTNVIIDLTHGGSIYVEPYGKLTLKKATGATAIAGGGSITTNASQIVSMPNKGNGVVGRARLLGTLATSISGGAFNTANPTIIAGDGVIGGGSSDVTIDQYDCFTSNNGVITVENAYIP